MKNGNKVIVASVLVLVLLVSGIGGAVALAQGPTPPAKNWGDLYRSALAQKLGTTVEKLQQAMTDARKEAVDQAVKQGLLTQAQGDQLQRRVQGPAIALAVRTSVLDAAAKALGMSTADLTTALKTKTLLGLATEKKVDVATLRTAIANAEKAAIDQAVKDGRLSQAQADAMKANIKPENVDLNGRRFGVDARARLKDMGRIIAPGGWFAPQGRMGAPTGPGGNMFPRAPWGVPSAPGGKVGPQGRMGGPIWR